MARAYATMKDVDTARGVIYRAECDLGKLSRGQRRDLLKDNLPWHADRCDDAERIIDRICGDAAPPYDPEWDDRDEAYRPGCGEFDTVDSKGRKLRPRVNEAGEPNWM